MPACTYSRLAQTQVWPALRNLEMRAPVTAASRSASSKTMKGALPPSSIDTFLTVPAHWASSRRPTSVEPVKENFFTVSLPVSSPPMARELPVSTLKTPGGTPARWASSPMASADSGVCEAGRTTKVQPAARAGAALRVIIALGKFQGVMAAHTPMGCFMTSTRWLLLLEGMMSP